MNRRQVDTAESVGTVAELLAKLSTSAAVTRARITTRGGFEVRDTATGEVYEAEGPALVLVINERMLAQGW